MNVHDSHIQAFHGYHNLLGKEILNENPNNYAINNDVVKGRELPGKRNNHRGPSYRNSGGLAYGKFSEIQNCIWAAYTENIT
jgi:hypothetical protein